MLKYALLASAMIFSVPAFAQDNGKALKTAPGREVLPPSSAAVPEETKVEGTESVAADTTAADQTVAEQKPATPTAPVDDVAVTTPTPPTPSAPAANVAATASSPPARATVAAAAPVNQASQVAQVVNTEFPSYDKDSNGSLSTTEFGSWMVALKAASDPSTKADSPAIKTWVAQAFASADKDKNSSITKDELTGFLTQG